MVISNPSSRKTPALSGFDQMGIIKSQEPFPITIMQCKTIFDTMGAFPRCFLQLPGFDLYPASLILSEDFTIKIQ
jgi:hypothetical protein